MSNILLLIGIWACILVIGMMTFGWPTHHKKQVYPNNVTAVIKVSPYA